MATPDFHVSRNRLCGSLSDVPLDKLLSSCAEHLITGELLIQGPSLGGRIELRAGIADVSTYGEAEDEAALVAMRALADGSYELAQRLPKLGGALGSAAECRGDLEQNSVIEIMRLCEDQALSCTITTIREFDRAEITYRAGDIATVRFNGKLDEDSLVRVVKWRTGKFRVSVPPLALNIDGWPTTSRNPTVPFNIADVVRTLPPPNRLRASASGTLPPPKRRPHIVAAPFTMPPVWQAPPTLKPADSSGSTAAVAATAVAAVAATAATAAVAVAVAVAVAPPARSSITSREPSGPVMALAGAARMDSSGQLTLRARTFADAVPHNDVLWKLLAAGVVVMATWLAVGVALGAF